MQIGEHSLRAAAWVSAVRSPFFVVHQIRPDDAYPMNSGLKTR